MRPLAYTEDPYLPAQLSHAPAARGERLLLAAIIERSVLDLRCARQRAPALDWIDDDSSEPWSFACVCEQLGLHPDTLRRVLRRRGSWPAALVTCAHEERARLSA